MGEWVTKGEREKRRHEGRDDNDDGEKTTMMMTTMRPCILLIRGQAPTFNVIAME